MNGKDLPHYQGTMERRLCDENRLADLASAFDTATEGTRAEVAGDIF
jgi:hypothetical protein